MTEIGTCHTCQNLFCEKPLMKTKSPERGCEKWNTPQAAKRKLEPLIIVEPLAEYQSRNNITPIDAGKSIDVLRSDLI